MTTPDTLEARHWLAQLQAVCGPAHLEKLNLDEARRLSSAGNLTLSTRREIWVAFSLIFCPSSLSTEIHYLTWGRFNPDMRNSYKLLAMKWLRRKSRQKAPIEHNYYCSPSNAQGADTKGFMHTGLQGKPWKRKAKKGDGPLDPRAGLPPLLG